MSRSTPRRKSTLAFMFSSEPWHSIETTPSQLVSARNCSTLRILSAFTPPPIGTCELPMPVSSPRAAAASDALTSLMWA